MLPHQWNRKGFLKSWVDIDFCAESQTSSEAGRPKNMTENHNTVSSWFPAKSPNNTANLLKIPLSEKTSNTNQPPKKTIGHHIGQILSILLWKG